MFQTFQQLHIQKLAKLFTKKKNWVRAKLLIFDTRAESNGNKDSKKSGFRTDSGVYSNLGSALAIAIDSQYNFVDVDQKQCKNWIF